MGKVSLSGNLPTLIFVAACGCVAFAFRERLKLNLKYESSPVDWCEENYAVVPWIAEFWNAVSSFAIGIPAVVGWTIYSKTTFENHEPNMYILWLSNSIVSIGSIYFHGTLSIAGQVLDELPIVILSSYSMFVLYPLNTWQSLRRRAVLFSWQSLVCVTLCLCLAGMLVPELSHAVCVSMMPIVLVTYSVQFHRCQKKPWKMFISTVCIFGLALAAWLVDKFACESAVSFSVSTFGFYVQLHALWHLLISATLWMTIMTGACIRLVGDKVDFAVGSDKVTGLIPVVYAV